MALEVSFLSDAAPSERIFDFQKNHAIQAKNGPIIIRVLDVALVP